MGDILLMQLILIKYVLGIKRKTKNKTTSVADMDPYMDVVVHFDLHFTTGEQTSTLIHIFLSRLHKNIQRYRYIYGTVYQVALLPEYYEVFSSYVFFFFLKTTTLMFRLSALVPSS